MSETTEDMRIRKANLQKWKKTFIIFISIEIISAIALIIYLVLSDQSKFIIYPIFMFVGIVFGILARNGKIKQYVENFNNFNTLIIFMMTTGLAIHILGYIYYKNFCDEPSKYCDATSMSDKGIVLDIFCLLFFIPGCLIHLRIQDSYKSLSSQRKFDLNW